MSDPAIDAARQIAGGSLDAMRQAIVGAPPGLLNWHPAGDDTNPIAVLAVHALNSTRWWLSVAIMGVAPERDLGCSSPGSPRRGAQTSSNLAQSTLFKHTARVFHDECGFPAEGEAFLRAFAGGLVFRCFAMFTSPNHTGCSGPISAGPVTVHHRCVATTRPPSASTRVETSWGEWPGVSIRRMAGESSKPSAGRAIHRSSRYQAQWSCSRAGKSPASS